jgi:hypothetical protein
MLRAFSGSFDFAPIRVVRERLFSGAALRMTDAKSLLFHNAAYTGSEGVSCNRHAQNGNRIPLSLSFSNFLAELKKDHN